MFCLWSSKFRCNKIPQAAGGAGGHSSRVAQRGRSSGSSDGCIHRASGLSSGRRQLTTSHRMRWRGSRLNNPYSLKYPSPNRLADRRSFADDGHPFISEKMISNTFICTGSVDVNFSACLPPYLVLYST